MALALALWLLAGISSAAAQVPVTVVGPVTPGNCPKFSSTTVLQDSGGSCNGSPTGPTAAVGLTAVPGSATTSLRSDAAPPLSASVQSALTGTNGLPLIGTGAFGYGTFTPGGDLSFSNPNYTINAGAVSNSKIAAGTTGTVKGTVSGSIADVLASTIVNTACSVTPSTCLSLLGYVSPIWYGAKCDGSTDDSTVFQTALNAAIAASAPLQIPNANCSLAANITNASNFANIIIRGSGSLSQVTFTSTFGFSFTGEAQYFNWTHFAINCGATACISVTNAIEGAANSFFFDLTINGGGTGGAVYFQNMSQTQFVNNRIVTNTASAYGLYIDDTQTSDAGGDGIIGNVIININASAGTAAINLINVGGVRVLGNAVSGYTTGIFNSLTISGGATGIQENNNQLDNLQDGIEFNATGSGATTGNYAHVTTVGNAIHASITAAAGIFSQTTSGSHVFIIDWTIDNNIISTLNGDAAILVAGATNYVIGFNTANDSGTPVGAAIQTTTPGPSTAGDCMILGNVVATYGTKLSNGVTCATSGATN